MFDHLVNTGDRGEGGEVTACVTVAHDKCGKIARRAGYRAATMRLIPV